MAERMEERVEDLEHTLYGKDGKFGVATKTEILWRSYVWILCTASFISGALVNELIKRL